MGTSKERATRHCHEMSEQDMHRRRQGEGGHKQEKLREEWRKPAAKNKISKDMNEQATQKGAEQQEGRGRWGRGRRIADGCGDRPRPP